MKKTLMLFLIIPILFVSCVDPVCRKYEVTIRLKNVDVSSYSCYAYLEDANGKAIVWGNLNDNDEFSYTDKPWSMGNQLDLRNPKEVRGFESLQDTLDRIAEGGKYIICEGTPQKLIKKYTIACTSDNVKDVTGDKLYRCYEITLDWNKRVPISE